MTTFDALTIGLPSATNYLECWVCSWRTCLLHRFALCVSCSLFNSDVILYSASAHSSAEVTLHWSQVSYTRIRFTHSGDIRLIVLSAIGLESNWVRRLVDIPFDQNTCYLFREFSTSNIRLRLAKKNLTG